MGWRLSPDPTTGLVSDASFLFGACKVQRIRGKTETQQLCAPVRHARTHVRTPMGAHRLPLLLCRPRLGGNNCIVLSIVVSVALGVAEAERRERARKKGKAKRD